MFIEGKWISKDCSVIENIEIGKIWLIGNEETVNIYI